MNLKRDLQVWLPCAAVIAADQYTKKLAEDLLSVRDAVTVIPGFFDLVLVRNRGAAFGFLNSPDIDWQFWLFAAAACMAIGVIAWLARSAQSSQHLYLGALGCIAGGAIGNLIDRVRFRSVVDFLDFYLGSWHWPAFNVADIAICCGAALAVIYMMREPKQS
ncbi:MAG: signal peptidase II [Desulfovibrionaceae bacterium]|nr:signal peptidase II [Desulfovibrionaceae bacterium]